MELKVILTFISDIRRYLLIGGLSFALLGGVLYYLIPQRYIAQGSLYITRSVSTVDKLPMDDSIQEFDYEGYYSQQNAQSYSGTVVALIESSDIKSEVLKKMSFEVNSKTLRELGRNITVKKKAPQLVYVSISALSQDQASKTWSILTESLIGKTSELNASGDSKLTVQSVSTEPIVSKPYRSLVLNCLVGFISGVVATGAVFLIKHNA